MSERLSFDNWKAAVNRHILNTCGLDADDLPDWGYWSAWNDGVSPRIAAREALEAADFPC